MFLLLDTGSSAVTRKAAAQQLGEVQRLHPHELPQLLKKVFTHLKSTSWDTRIAASQAINSVISHVPQWSPAPLVVKSEDGPKLEDSAGSSGRLKYNTFSIRTVLAHRHFLTASEGREFDDDDPGLTDPKERLAFQRNALNKSLGLEMAAKLGINTDDIISAEDLTENNHQPQPILGHQRSQDTATADEEAENLNKQLSSREANLAKRKARRGGKQRSLDSSPSSDAPSSKKAKKEKEEIIIVDSVPDPAGTWPDTATVWPFESFCDLLVTRLLSPSWEVTSSQVLHKSLFSIS